MVYIPWAGYNPKWTDQKKMKAEQKKKKQLIENTRKNGLKPNMASCFDFRSRTTSFDLHNIGQGHKMSLLSKLFRSKSDSQMKVPKQKSPGGSPTDSPKGSPKSSPGAPTRRRFVRVIRDDQCLGEEYSNPHVVRKYNPGFWDRQQQMRKSQSLDESGNRPLPYTVSGHTILKKHHSVDSSGDDITPPSSSSNLNKHAKFKDDVEVLEYDIKGKCLFIHADSCVIHTKLHDDDYLDFDLQTARDSFDVLRSEVEQAESLKLLTLDAISEKEDNKTPDNSPEEKISVIPESPKEDSVFTESPTESHTDTSTDSTDSKQDESKATESDSQLKTSRQSSVEEESSAPKKSKREEHQGDKTIPEVPTENEADMTT